MPLAFDFSSKVTLLDAEVLSGSTCPSITSCREVDGVVAVLGEGSSSREVDGSVAVLGEGGSSREVEGAVAVLGEGGSSSIDETESVVGLFSIVASVVAELSIVVSGVDASGSSSLCASAISRSRFKIDMIADAAEARYDLIDAHEAS
jgi:hypothetical protein